MKCRARSFAALVLVVSMAAICYAQDFSAEVVYANAPNKEDASARGTAPPAPLVRLYVSDDKMRFESRGLVDLIMIVDPTNHTTVTLFPTQMAYRQLGSRPSLYFRATDAENACPDWQKAAGKQLTCEKVGNDVVDGRETIKYKSSAPSGSAEYIWIDRKLDYIIKWDMGKTGAEVRNIKEGPQSADLFVIPPGYQVLKPARKPPGSIRPQRK